MARIMTIDGNEAAAYISYAFTEVAAIYPITPSSPMAELVDEWSARGRKNIFGEPVRVVEMQSEAGAAGTMHGSLAVGALTTTYTASQGLLLMIPNMYKIAGELLPGVFHVSARALATHALSIFGDHQDVMACRQTGFAMLASANVQEVMDLGCVAHLAAIKARVPFLHFFDGFRTSHEIQKIEALEYDEVAKLLDQEALQEFRKRGLNPAHPVIRGTAQNPDIYFQGREVANPFYEAVPGIVEGYLKEIGKLTGRHYNLFDYYGDPEAESIIVVMGSACNTVEEVVDYLRSQGEKVGVVKVRLYRPFSKLHFLQAVPKTVKRIAVLDRTKEPGSLGEPLYLDVVKAFQGEDNQPLIVGGRYGLGSKDTRPSQILAVYRNLKQAEPKDRFTIGIVDDVSGSSLPEEDIVDTTPEGTISCKFWGLGSDGTVGANKSAVKIIGENTDLHVQAYFSYDSKKSGGTTVSHLRFGKKPIKSSYLVHEADYIACHNSSFVNNYDLLKGIKDGGIFVLNCPWEDEELEENLPASLKRTIAEKNVQFYTIDALSIAGKVGLGNRINMIMQAAFFRLAGVIPFEEAIRQLKDSVESMYGRKGRNVVEMNFAAIDQGIDALRKVEVPASWKDAQDEVLPPKEVPEFVEKIQTPMARQEGDELPVSAFVGMEDGTFPVGTTAYEKRGIAVMLPEWQIDKCIQCGQCSFVCPHATIRQFLLDQEEIAKAPETFVTKQALGRGLQDYGYRIQVSPLDCTGCGNCADICPAPEKALVMRPAEEILDREADNWEFAMTIKEKSDLLDWKTLKGSQLRTPLFEFHGACPGCGETPYLRLISQLFGDRMIIANATGCSSIYTASAPSMAYTTNREGRGPAWANSLFEDNAEFGYGMWLGMGQLRKRIANVMEQLLRGSIDEELANALGQWLDAFNDGEKSLAASKAVREALEKYKDSTDPLIQELISSQDYLVKPSQWIIGGDGWAYDIGYGGLDHVLATGADVNILVMDTEVYSNTGGQSSKSTPTAAVAKFAASGKRIRKKDLGRMAMSYGYVYVAQIAMGANLNHTLRTLIEAEAYPGPSLIIAYSPCINHGIRTGMGTSIMQEKKAVEAGYWHLYRYNPQRKLEGKNPFTLDSKDPSGSFQEFLTSEVRYSSLRNTFPDIAEELFTQAEQDAKERLEEYKRLAALDY
ncbi:MAG TPA: pyruvate:ferredoxin (flavodoxin) oxidoreductase [Firmicutes bacterium]|nr:pyruvate:ferredoxin (flavodoxin) oxidoreductase [Bacillota bacterium]